MDGNLIECESAQRDPGPGRCACGAGAPTLAVLRDVHRAYEHRMEAVDKLPPSKKLQLQVELLRAWVGDLVGQNSLLARAVEELETEATTQLLRERRRHSEASARLRRSTEALRRRLARTESDLKGLLELLRRMREYDDNYTLAGIHFFGLTHSDIFGSVEMDKLYLGQEKGDITNARTYNSNSKQLKLKNNRHRQKINAENKIF